MFCSKCGKEIQNGSNCCTYCGAQQVKAATQPNKTVVAVIIVAAVFLAAAIFEFVAAKGGSGLSGTWEYIADPYVGGYDYTIELNSDGTCIIYEYGRVPYSATYTSNDDGTYVTSSLFTSTVFGAWKIRKDGSDLIISGSGLGSESRFTRVY